ncbi:MAG: ABC transporter ATP-binding protein/permease [Eubacteriales bacterium]|nr:ABC transporter ATP-binding protein/permease [Eubacteriales bacterium]
MLQIKNIRKEYKTGGLVQKALDGVSLNFRDSEFVAILGPSGSGKTTFLNVLGGLDQYDSGDLIINGTSTKKYTDRDWDSYRNHTIGFVFQSYNLIPHQTILSNVELALTISGIGKEERKQKAAEALTKVGLGDQLHKKPSQLSGGQMQRVAIARALVNDPDILLADEPTGALDSVTSVQIMDILKEVAKDHLVVMVTHNPELAYQYANRIVELKDGNIISDSDPFEITSKEAGHAVHRNLGKAAMNFATALQLSFNNLKTKKARTFLVAFAGSIGIIGIAMILSLSNGVNQYIHGIEEDTIREYPLTVDSSGFDLSAMFSSAGMGSDDSKGSAKKGEVKEMQTVTNMFSMMESNDLKSLKKYIDSGKSGLEKHTRAIEYTYNVKPQIFRKNGTDYRQVNPDQTRKKMGMSISSSMSYSSMMSTDVFHQLPTDSSLYKDEYDVKAGHWPKKNNECVVVLSKNGMVSDLALYAMGLKDSKDLDKMLKDFSKGKDVKLTEDQTESFSYDDCLGIKFKRINNADYYSYDSSQGVWVDRSDDSDYMDDIIAKGDDMKIVGVVQPKEDVDFTVLQGDIYYPSSLTDRIIDEAGDSKVVKAQKKSKNTNILTGKEFGEESDGPDFQSMFSIDQKAFAKAFNFDASQLSKAMKSPSKNMDLSGLIDPKDVQNMQGMSQADMQKMMSGAKLNFTEDTMQTLFNQLMKGFLANAAKNGKDYTKMNSAFGDYMKSDSAKKILAEDIKELVKSHVDSVMKENSYQGTMKEVLSGFPAYLKEKGIEDPDKFSGAIDDYLSSSEVSQKLSGKESELKEKLENIEVTDAESQKILDDLVVGYAKFAKENNYPTTEEMAADFQKYLTTDEAQGIINMAVAKSMDTSQLEKTMAATMTQYSSKAVASMAEKLVSGMMTNYMKSMGSLDFSKAFKVNTDAFADALGMNMSEDEIQSLIMSLMGTSANTYDANMSNFGYADKAQPTQIAIYAKDFDSKAKIKDILDGYNDKMVKAGKSDQEISYNDLAGALMGSVTDIIDAISYVLIAFVSISLIVSSIMIGVITYISVLERKKEIGILRAIGASKHNVAQVFNAETFIIGALAGLIGIGVTEILIIPTNIIIGHLTSVGMHVALPAVGGVVLVILSIVLTLIGGIIPSRKAAKSDPVTALRVD